MNYQDNLNLPNMDLSYLPFGTLFKFFVEPLGILRIHGYLSFLNLPFLCLDKVLRGILALWTHHCHALAWSYMGYLFHSSLSMPCLDMVLHDFLACNTYQCHALAWSYLVSLNPNVMKFVSYTFLRFNRDFLKLLLCQFMLDYSLNNFIK